jgi:pyrroline-5-carboxylate reductase
MPNIPALVRSGASVFVTGSKATDRDAQLTKKLLKSVGTCEQVTENLLDAITALSGSGPAYVMAPFGDRFVWKMISFRFISW